MSGQDAEFELRSLCDWLRHEPDVARSARIAFGRGVAEPGEMGVQLEVIQLVMDSGFQALNLALAYAAWRATRASKPRVVIECSGAKVSLDDADPDLVHKIVRAMDKDLP
jgi:hypothetical protein